jgi:hypothetical protein
LHQLADFPVQDPNRYALAMNYSVQTRSYDGQPSLVVGSLVADPGVFHFIGLLQLGSVHLISVCYSVAVSRHDVQGSTLPHRLHNRDRRYVHAARLHVLSCISPQS